jgi:hypothetical protein
MLEASTGSMIRKESQPCIYRTSIAVVIMRSLNGQSQDLAIELADQFALGIYSFGTFGFAGLPYFGALTGLFHALCLGYIGCRRAVRHRRHRSIFPRARFTSPAKTDLTSTGIATPHHTVFI